MEQDEYRERLAHDVATWQRSGLITAEQERAILSRIGAGEPRLIGALRLGWLVTAVSIVGAIVLAAGVVLLFATNWDEIPGGIRTALPFAGMLAAYGIGYALMERYEMQRIGSAFLLLGALLFQGGLFLLALIYDLPLEQPFSFPVLWLLAALGVLPLAYLFRSRIVLLVAIADGALYVLSAMLDRYPDAPESVSAVLVVAVYGIGLYAVGRLHSTVTTLKHFEDVYVFSGLLTLLALVYVFTFSEPWEEVIDSSVESFAAPPVVYVSIATAAALVAAQLWARRGTIEIYVEEVVQMALLALAAIVATWPDSTVYDVVFNVVFFAVAAAVVVRGYLSADEHYINFGLAAVAVGLLTRYMDLFWSALPGSAFFIVGGVLLLGVALGIERLRRSLINSMDIPDVSDMPPGPSRGTGEAPA